MNSICRQAQAHKYLRTRVIVKMQGNKQIDVANILHITSGEVVAALLQKQYPQADILPFNEAMCEGETCAEIFTDEFYALRATAYNVTVSDYLQKSPGNFLQTKLQSYAALHLYFDYDMFCVVNIITLLAFLEQAHYTGQIKLYILEADGTVNILDTWPIVLKIYDKCYRSVLVNRQKFSTGNGLFDKGIALYLDYKKEQNKITKYIAAHAAVANEQLLSDLLKKFAEYGLTDVAAAKFIDAVRNKYANH